MTPPSQFGYHRDVAAVRSGARHWLAAGALSLIAVLGLPWAARASTTAYPVADAAVVQISARWANVTIRTWDRNVVQIDWPDDAALSAIKTTMQTEDRLFIRAVSDEEKIAPTERVMVTLEPEDFPVPKLAVGRHDAVRVWQEPQPADTLTVKGAPPAQITVMIPDSTGLLSIHLGRGDLTVHDYHGTTNVGLHNGHMVFDDVGGDAFVQPLNGRFYAVNSSFDFLRIRSNGADEVFDACRVKDIQATTLSGNILYDNGSFDPGLARFETDRGSIALGVNGGAQLGAHAGDGRVISVLPASPDLPVIAAPGFDRTRVAGDGGPLVNALSANGSVFLYAGSLADRGRSELGDAWRPMVDLLAVNRRIARRTLRPLREPRMIGRPQ